MQTVSLTLYSEMETEPCCEERTDPAVEPKEPKVREARLEATDKDRHTELACGSAVQGKEETQSCAGEIKGTEIKSTSNPESGDGETGCKERRKLKKTNSWKMVRFQDPSEEENVSERDSAAESLFAEYVMEEWTSSTFAVLFAAEDWKDITGEDTSAHSTSHARDTHFRFGTSCIIISDKWFLFPSL